MRYDNTTTIYLKNGKTIKRVIHNGYYQRYVIYNGKVMSVEYICGKYYQKYD